MNLSKFLVHEAKRGKMHKVEDDETTGKPGLKTPLVMKTSFHEDLEDFLVSDSKGSLLHRPNAEGGVPSVFFPLDVHDEDAYQLLVADRIFVRGCESEWGNVVITKGFTDEDFVDYLTYFEAYELEFSQVFCGPLGFEALRQSNRMVHPSRSAPLDSPLTHEEIVALQDSYFFAGSLHHRPVFYNDLLDPYVLFAAPPQAVGLITRINDFASVVLHNPERGVIVARLDDSLMTPDPDDNHDEEE